MSWDEFEKEMKRLASKIDYTPETIVGVVRGGLIPARILSSELKVRDMFGVTVRKVGDERKILCDTVNNLKGKEILLVEDVLETGKSLLVAKQYLEDQGAIVKTACLYTHAESKETPDYFLKEINGTVKFPWEG